MKTYKNHIKIASIFFLTVAASACTKLDQQLNSSLTSDQAANALGANGTQLILQSAYNDLGAPYGNLGGVFALEEVTADETVVPTRAGDWDDNGAWRALKKQTFGPSGVNNIRDVFNNLNRLSFDATNVLAFTHTDEQAAEARFLRALALYQLLDLYGQFPYREAKENLLNAPKVYSGDSAVQFIINEVTTILPQLGDGNTSVQANKSAAQVLLMKLYLNRGAFLNRESPTFEDADMQKVITLGNEIINSGKYSYNPNYFDNFSATNSGTPEGIFASPNTSGVATNNNGVHDRWWATLHYNSYRALAPQAGWNGFSTVADFYNSFGVNTPATQTPADTLLDTRLGGRFYKGVTDVSGIRPGFLIGQQYYENGDKVKDRKGNLLIFDPNIVEDLKETGPTLEDKGIRVVKYPPDFSNNGKNYAGGTSGNWVWIFRYPDVVLMVAEAKMRATVSDAAGALALVNGLRAARGTTPLSSMSLVNPSDVYDRTTLLAERGRELYWESY